MKKRLDTTGTDYKTTTTGTATLANGHAVTYKQTTHTGYFAKTELVETEYTCSCGATLYKYGRHLKANLDTHDTWQQQKQEAKNLLADFLIATEKAAN